MASGEVGPLEMRVLGYLTRDTPQSVSHIRERLAAEGSPLAYTTVMTVLRRLYERAS